MKSGSVICPRLCASDRQAALGEIKGHTSAAILINATSQWSQALRTGKALAEAGTAVTLIFLGHAPLTVENPVPGEPGIECFADTSQMGMRSMSLNEIAEKLKHCDLVIPL